MIEQRKHRLGERHRSHVVEQHAGLFDPHRRGVPSEPETRPDVADVGRLLGKPTGRLRAFPGQCPTDSQWCGDRSGRDVACRRRLEHHATDPLPERAGEVGTEAHQGHSTHRVADHDRIAEVQRFEQAVQILRQGPDPESVSSRS